MPCYISITVASCYSLSIWKYVSLLSSQASIARLVHGTRLDKERPEYARGIIYTEFQNRFESISTNKKNQVETNFSVTMTDGSQASSRLLSMRGANCLICLPKADPKYHGNNILPADTIIPVLLLGELEPTHYSEAQGPIHFPLCFKLVKDQCKIEKSSNGICSAEKMKGSDIGGDQKKDMVKSLSCPCCENQEKGNKDDSSTILSKSTIDSVTPLLNSNEKSSKNNLNAIKVCILTVSDRAFEGVYEDESGALIRSFVEGPNSLFTTSNAVSKSPLVGRVIEHSIVPDDIQMIQDKVKYFADTLGCDIIFTTGGTGFSPRDVTPEAIKPLLDKEAPGIIFRIMQVGTEYTPFAVLSRPVAGVRKNTFIVTFPGSVKAVTENFNTVLPLLPKILGLIQKGVCDHKK